MTTTDNAAMTTSTLTRLPANPSDWNASNPRGDGVTLTFRVIDPSDLDQMDGARCVALRVSHWKGHGVSLHVQPCRFKDDGKGFVSESFMVFAPEPRDKPKRITLRASKRRNDKLTAAIAAAITEPAHTLARAYFDDPTSEETAAAIADVIARAATV